MSFNFYVIGSNEIYYFLVAYEKMKVLKDGVYFLKIPIDFFDFIDEEKPVISFLFDVELYLDTFYEDLIEDGYLTEITEQDFKYIDFRYRGD